jgi:U4/U6.U5 tri-snRNP-associated protein 1
MAAALKLAMSKGYLEKEEEKMIVISKSAQELQAQRYTIEDKTTYICFVICLCEIEYF